MSRIHGYYDKTNAECLQLKNTYDGIKSRCYNKGNKSYHRYGGRGVRVCSGWHNFENFKNDMGYRPSKEHSVDRIENNGDYSCGKCEECIREGWKLNCRWATQHEQQRNRRDNIWLEYNGEKKTMQDWANQLKVDRGTILYQHRKGIPFEVLFKRYTNRNKKRQLTNQ